MARIFNKNIFIATETHAYTLTIFRLRDISKKDYRVLDY